MRDPHRLHVNLMVAAHRSGAYSLPSEMMAAYATCERVTGRLNEAATAQARVSIARLVERQATALVTAATKNVRLPSAIGSPLIDAEAEDRALGADLRVLARAQEQADLALMGSVYSGLGTIVTDHLRPAMDETLATVREVAPTFRDGIPADEAIPFIPEPLVASWRVLDDAAKRYAAIRDAQWRVETLGGAPTLDTLHGEFSQPDHPMVWGDRWRGRYQSSWRPGPSGRLERMLWLATLPAGVVVMLTGAEQDDLTRSWRAKYGPKRPHGVLVTG